jgi:hypothetical protein
MSEQLARLEDILRRGYDSMAIVKCQAKNEKKSEVDSDENIDLTRDDSPCAEMMREFKKFLQVRRGYSEDRSQDDVNAEYVSEKESDKPKSKRKQTKNMLSK